MYEDFLTLVDHDTNSDEHNEVIILKVYGERELTAEDIDQAAQCVANLFEEDEFGEVGITDTDTCMQAVTETLEALGFQWLEVLRFQCKEVNVQSDFCIHW